MSSTLPPGLTGLFREANRLGEEQWCALTNELSKATGIANNEPWQFSTTHKYHVKAQVAILCDLNRQASRDWAMSWLASRVHIDGKDGLHLARKGLTWWLSSSDEHQGFAETATTGRTIAIPGLNKAQTPGEALAIICPYVDENYSGRNRFPW